MIQENYRAIDARVAAACEKAGRRREDVTLVAVSKTKPEELIRELMEIGVRDFGENKVQDLCRKMEDIPGDNRWHMIGGLQRNKVKQVVGKVDLIQSVDSARLLAAIDKEAKKQGIVQDILLEVNVGGEESKSGFRAEEILPLVQSLAQFPNIRVKGLMTIPPISQKNGDNIKFFQKIYNIAVDIIALLGDNGMAKYLSMGMSDDFTDAIACGSTMIRVGTAIFGARDYSKLHQT